MEIHELDLIINVNLLIREFQNPILDETASELIIGLKNLMRTTRIFIKSILPEIVINCSLLRKAAFIFSHFILMKKFRHYVFNGFQIFEF